MLVQRRDYVTIYPENAKTNVGLMVGCRRRRRASIKLTLGQCISLLGRPIYTQ